MVENIFIVEDEQDLVMVLEYNLKKEGYRTTASYNGSEALSKIFQGLLPDLILLDLMLPDISGLDLCRQLRADERTKDIPVLMLTARSEEVDRIKGFEVGADDYVAKPFSVKELMLRVKALLRRTQIAEGTSLKIEFGCLILDKEAHRVWVEGKEIFPTVLEFRLLTTMLDRKGRVQTRERLLSDVWEMTADVTTRTVDTHIKRLREKLAVAGSYLETVRGVGYRFVEAPDINP